jgi:ribosomal protein L21E
MLMAKLKVGEKMKIPVHSVFHQESGHVGKVVFISEDCETVTVKCDRKHGGKTVAFNIALVPREL